MPVAEPDEGPSSSWSSETSSFEARYNSMKADLWGRQPHHRAESSPA